jgi:hypothetical protein
MSLDSRDLRVGAAYERARAEARSDAIELRRRRRVDLGDLISVVFESRATLAAAAEEALRSERIEDLERVDEEAGRFGVLLPAAGGLAATLFVEVSDAAEMASVLRASLRASSWRSTAAAPRQRSSPSAARPGVPRPSPIFAST